MFPVTPNQFEALPLDQFVTHLYFHDGIATVRDCGRLHKIAPSRQIYRAVEKRRSELRAAGYRTISYMDTDMIHVYAPAKRAEYRRDKYGTLGPALAFGFIVITILLFIWEQIKWGF